MNTEHKRSLRSALHYNRWTAIRTSGRRGKAGPHPAEIYIKCWRSSNTSSRFLPPGGITRGKSFFARDCVPFRRLRC